MAELIYAGHSDVGRKRKQNQDAWAVDEELGLYLVSDGMGGQARGDVASRIVADTLPPLLRRRLDDGWSVDDESLPMTVARAVSDLSREIRKEGDRRPGMAGLGATLVAVLARAGRALFFHLGDSRAYLLRKGRLARLTKDHSIVQALLDAGEIKASEAKTHPARGKITRAMGMKGVVRPGFRRMSLLPRDRILLCCDGLTDMCSDADLERAMRKYTDPEEASRRLVAMANAAGGKDNITAVILDRH